MRWARKEDTRKRSASLRIDLNKEQKVQGGGKNHRQTEIGKKSKRVKNIGHQGQGETDQNPSKRLKSALETRWRGKNVGEGVGQES